MMQSHKQSERKADAGVPDEQGAARGHAPEGTSIKAVYITAAALVGLITASLAVVWALTAVLAAISGARSEATVSGATREGMPSAGEVRKRLQVRDEQLLTSYGWLNRPDGSARIPIERAMELIVEHPELAQHPEAQ
jgi:hypothetical protein